ncbi:MAG TPA: low temperature requirement protein A, partial [Cryptosporangiaceae bacterium]|nr:low temperature requirement protein A [Cryptosporangiaceae bacterium]
MSSPLPASASAHGEQRVTWAELFFDLVWVFAITQIAIALAAAHGPGEAVAALLLLVPLWWGWVGTTVFGNVAGTSLERTRGRLVLFTVAGCGLVMAVAIPAAYGRLGLLFVGSYVALRLLLWAAMRWRRNAGDGRAEVLPASQLASLPLFVAGAFAPGGWRLALWALAGLAEVLTPILRKPPLGTTRVETSHLPERFGLFIIVAFGETVVAVGGQAATQVDAGRIATLALCFVVIVALWWSYFHFSASAVRHSLEHDPEQARIVRDVFSYAHFLYVIAIIGVAVGLKKLLAHPLDSAHSLPELLLAPGVGLYLLGFCYARWRMFGAAALPRLFTSLACFALTPAALVLPLV